MKKIILASQSPQRRKLLKQLGLNFKVIPSKIDETLENGGTICERIEKLALKKAQNIADFIDEEALIIGADTVVVLDEILGKPPTKEDAISMLKKLSGKTHQVITGISIIDTLSKKQCSSSQITYVTMRPYSEQDIHRYINSGEYQDKAGSYAIQGLGALLVEKIDGDYFNIVGLPISVLNYLLKKFDFDIFSLYDR
ncbi:Maf family protein [Garciella nitratireducens]|uniref:Nucleoside triphosphate pyrophosphatase n=1 Tax=Garciella nitratireducens DSM 15102 TaxID=1121911 RepID=A0A1T4K9J4_9FIRM|nr:Maf family protein [Garciella nitratireducens]RBP46716.1 septum formation protein [Garciella nitratireducens]SJZ39079.1 septum formation protein [Garciella nitratireducens DSM 15102]